MRKPWRRRNTPKSDLIDRYNLPPEKVSVVYNGLRPELFDTDADSRPACLDADRYFLFVGTFAPRKNLQTVVRAFARIHTDVPERLVVVAYPDERQETIRELARSLKVLDKMAFCSGLTNAELAYLYRHATGLLLLSEYEGFGYPPLEAMATKTPAIVSDSTSLGGGGRRCRDHRRMSRLRCGRRRHAALKSRETVSRAAGEDWRSQGQAVYLVEQREAVE